MKVVWDIVSQCQEDYQAQIDVDLASRNPDVLNVKENAIKYSGNKPVLIRLEQVNERLNLSVIDQGIGISAHESAFDYTDNFTEINNVRYTGFIEMERDCMEEQSDFRMASNQLEHQARQQLVIEKAERKAQCAIKSGIRSRRKCDAGLHRSWCEH
ncbi:hypothetical protein FQR65_LT15186 [Abscondita terminalis]|nr:hypothetical protein FQR65_LT15186 [Abscondita terminalis]